MSNQSSRTTPIHEPIQSLWVGDRLTTMEQLSIISFLANGHPYHLYLYDEIKGVPENVVLKNAEEILPRAQIFKQKKYDTVASFSSLFRYKLLRARGGYWADSDVVCLKPFDWKSEYVFASENQEQGNAEVANAVIKAPADSEIMRYCFEAALERANPDVQWGEMRRLLNKAVQDFALNKYLLPPSVFNPIDYFQWKQIVTNDADGNWSALLADPNAGGRTSLGRVWRGLLFRRSQVHAVHLWHEMWRRDGIDCDVRFPPRSLYEQLKRKYLESKVI